MRVTGDVKGSNKSNGDNDGQGRWWEGSRPMLMWMGLDDANRDRDKMST